MKRAIATLSLALWCGPAFAQTPSDICVPGYAREHRMSAGEAHAIKLEMMRREHPGEPLSAYTLDHRVPLEVGGSNDLSNLMLQSRAEARRKDRLENFARRAVCAGSVSLNEAQGWFVDWEASYKRAFGTEP